MLNRPKVFFYLQRILSGNYPRIRQVLRDEVHLQENQTVLELACGTGNIADFFDSVNYIGVDINQDYIRFAKAQSQKEFLVVDVRQLCFNDGNFDWVIAVGLFHHLSDADTLSTIKGVQRVLNGGGQMVIIDAIPPTSKLNILGYILRKLDRGKYIRHIEQYKRLFGEHFTIGKMYQYRNKRRPLDYCVFVLDQEPIS